MASEEAYRLLIGSIGDDSHSIGMSLLEIYFKEAGFFVKNLGILNVLDDFFAAAGNFDVIFVSCMNGHAELYFHDFVKKLRSFNRRNGPNRVWYLGGNLSVQGEDERVIKKFLKLGFDFVTPKPVLCQLIMERLLKDLHKKKIKKRMGCYQDDGLTDELPLFEDVDDRSMTDREFRATREMVLDSWPTGSQVWNADILRNHSCKIKNLHYKILQHQGNGSFPLVQPRTGVAHTCDEINILLYLRSHGLDISSIQLDAASRKKMYKKAQEGFQLTAEGRSSFLNGYPVPVHGVKGIEEIVRSIHTPFQIRAGSPDHRLVYEIGLAGGASSVEGGFICYLLPYDKSTSPQESLLYWKYVDKLASWYYKKYNIIINREYFGPLTCFLIEPSIAICVNIIQAILSAKSGVKCISVGLAEQGNRVQDIAAVRSLDRMARIYLTMFGFPDVTVSTVYHHYMSAFPTDINKARELIVNSSVSGALAGASRLLTKTPVESNHIPSKEDNAESLRLTHKGLMKSKELIVDWRAVQREMDLLEREVHAIMSSVRMLGGGSISRGAIRAIQKGILDIPFSPNRYVKKELITVRDRDGAIRFFNPENLPFDDDIIDFHREKIYRRMNAEKTSRISEILEKDLTRIWKNDYLKWPLDGHYVS